MKRFRYSPSVIAGILLLCSLLSAQQTETSPSAIVPRLVNYSGKAIDSQGKAISGVAGITFSIYKDQDGGAPLWMETQNVTADAKGNYTVQLGAMSAEGLPLDLFTTGEARWLGVRLNGAEEQPRVLLLSVPYALKAADAQTLGGLPASAFLLAGAANAAAAQQSNVAASVESSASPATSSDVTTAGGTEDTIPLFSTATNIQNSILTQTGTTTINVAGKLNLPALGTATASAGFNSRPQDFVASAYNSGTSTAVNQKFQWQAEATNNDTSTASGTLNLLFGQGTSTPAETGLHIASNGQITFATGQIFPGTGTGDGTITGVTAGAGLTGGGSSGSVSLALASNSCAAGHALTALPFTCLPFATLGANSFTASQGVTGNVTASGVVTGGSFNIGSRPFAFGSYANGNAFLGFSGNSTSTGTLNATTGVNALDQNTTGSSNAAIGSQALYYNNTGSVNTASGFQALYNNTTGSYNTASSSGGLANNSTGSANTAVGYYTLSSNTTGSYNTALGTGANVGYGNLTNATAIGSNAEVNESNALVLGAITGVNGGTSVNVGIGTTTPLNQLDVHAQSNEIYAINADGFGLGTSNGGVALGGIYSFGGNGLGGGNGLVGQGGDGPDADGDGGVFYGGNESIYGDGLLADAGSGYAGDFYGNVTVSGTLSAGSKDFKIDHPLDPANKYLVHASVESSEMMNIYTGNVTTDAQGEATVQLPGWFETLNTDFRYQLTVIGQFAQAIIAHKIQGNQFTIRTNAPNVEVSWQITGVRQDAYAKVHPLVVEEEKDARLKGFYIYPELYGQPGEKQIEWARHPQQMKRMQERRQSMKQPQARPMPSTTGLPSSTN